MQNYFVMLNYVSVQGWCTTTEYNIYSTVKVLTCVWFVLKEFYQAANLKDNSGLFQLDLLQINYRSYKSLYVAVLFLFLGTKLF